MAEPLVRVTLTREQSDRLRFLQERMRLRPPLSGLVRHAVDELLDDEFRRRGLSAEYAAQHRDLRVVPGGARG